MNELSRKHCEACHKWALPVPEGERETLLETLQGWEIKTQQGIPRLIKNFYLEAFPLKMAFVNEIALLAEKEDHHPVMIIGPEKVIVKWWTHVIEDLHRNDFIMAAKTEEVFINLTS